MPPAKNSSPTCSSSQTRSQLGRFVCPILYTQPIKRWKKGNRKTASVRFPMRIRYENVRRKNEFRGQILSVDVSSKKMTATLTFQKERYRVYFRYSYDYVRRETNKIRIDHQDPGCLIASRVLRTDKNLRQ